MIQPITSMAKNEKKKSLKYLHHAHSLIEGYDGGCPRRSVWDYVGTGTVNWRITNIKNRHNETS